MSIHSTLVVWLLLICAALAAGCTAPAGGSAAIGTLDASGSNVFVNKRPATRGTPIYSGDEVTTGPDTSAVIQFSTGGYFQLDENTDPLLSLEALGSIKCIVVKIFRGRAYGEKARLCVVSPAGDALVGSTINVVVSTAETQLTLLDGTVIVERPQRVVLVPGQEATVRAGVPAVQVSNLSPAGLCQRVAWRTKYSIASVDSSCVAPSARELLPHTSVPVPVNPMPGGANPASPTAPSAPVPPPAPAPAPAPTPSPPSPAGGPSGPATGGGNPATGGGGPATSGGGGAGGGTLFLPQRAPLQLQPPAPPPQQQIH